MWPKRQPESCTEGFNISPAAQAVACGWCFHFAELTESERPVGTAIHRCRVHSAGTCMSCVCGSSALTKRRRQWVEASGSCGSEGTGSSIWRRRRTNSYRAGTLRPFNDGVFATPLHRTPDFRPRRQQRCKELIARHQVRTVVRSGRDRVSLGDGGTELQSLCCERRFRRLFFGEPR